MKISETFINCRIFIKLGIRVFYLLLTTILGLELWIKNSGSNMAIKIFENSMN